jgi:hypothetical protein
VLRRILTTLVLLAGCYAIGKAALYPPRRERLHAVGIGNQSTQVETFSQRKSDAQDLDREIPRVSLFHSNPHYLNERGYGPVILTEIDTGRLVAESLLFFAITGVLLALLNLLPSSSSRSVLRT